MDIRGFVSLFYLCMTCVFTTGEVHVKIVEVAEEEGCAPAVRLCQETHTQLAFGGLPQNFYSPDELNQRCSSRDYVNCLNAINKDTCSEIQKLDIEGSTLADEYVCSEDGIEQYKEGNEYDSSPWKPLQKDYMVVENDMCRDKFLDKAQNHMKTYEVHSQELDQLDDESRDKEIDLTDKAEESRDMYCNYMYSYQTCVVEAAKRHCNETISDWQQEMTEKYYTPHFKQLKCHIGTGLEQVTINAIIIASMIILCIFSLAIVCGVYEKCGEKLQACRRKKKDDAENGSVRDSIVFPDKNGGMPTRTESRVRFDINT